MVKSFKKVIASLLAVLMVVCAMPFTALAAVDTDEPNIKLLFNPVYTGNSGYFSYGESDKKNYQYTMLQEAPLTYDYKYDEATGAVSGTLTLETAKTEPICNDLGVDPLDEDTQLGVGDYFSVTVAVEGIETINAMQQFIQYSENIEPAGIYTRTAKRVDYYGLAGMSDANYSSVKVGGESAVDSNSAVELYDGLDDGKIGNISAIDSEKRIIKSINSVQNGESGIDVTAITNEEFAATNPEDGSLDYDFAGVCVANTFIFKIIDEGDISFQMYDPDNTKEKAFGGSFLLATNVDGTGNDQYTTYATVPQEGGKMPLGAGKTTFMGGNIITGVVPEAGDPGTHEHTFATTWSKDETHHWHAATCGHDTEKSDYAEHSYTSETTTPATCTTPGVTTYTCACGDTYTDETLPAATGHKYAEAWTTNATSHWHAATCGHNVKSDEANHAGGTATCTAKAVCSTCGASYGELAEHSFTTKASSQVASAATCTEAETRFVQCDNCTAVDTTKTVSVGKAKGHSFKNYVSNSDATPAKDGTKTATCENGCGTTDTIDDEGTATGVNVTVKNTYDSFGSAAYGTKNYAFGDTVTLTAEAYEACEFIGWQVADKIVSTKATYEFQATFDVTVTPVFHSAEAEEISVIFYDKYMNVIASYMDYTVADFQAAMATKIPTAPVYAGYKFAGYSYTDPEILALDKSATIVAYYNEDKAQGFTVETTADATITVDAKRGTKETDQKYVDVMFDTQATVTAPGATAWKVDDAIVGYGESYTFFVGSDIKLVPVFEVVEATPAVAMVKAYKIAADSHKIMFLASMNIPAGYDLVDHGFVYGKNMTAADLVLENVGNKGTAADAGDVKKTSAGTNTVEQFGISYGITKQTGKACAKAYLTFAKDGVITTIYSDAVAYDYATGKTIPVEEGVDD